MYRNYKELFYALVNFYNGTIDYGQEIGVYKFLAPSVSLLDNVPFQKIAEACLEDDFKLYSPATINQKGTRNNEITLDESFNTLTLKDFLYISLIFIYFVVTKRFISKKIRNSAIVNSFGLRKKDVERSKECIWRLIYYGCSSVWLTYSCFIKHQHGKEILSQGESISSYSLTVDFDEYLICIIEVSFYLHATYAILFEDVWKYDSPMMLFHHIVATITISSIYSMKIHKIGLTAIVLRDTCDFELEVAKLFMCFRIQHGNKVKSFENLVKIFFAIFTATFFINQLYYYPLFCIYHGFNFVRIHQLRSSIVTSIVTGCVTFLVLDLLWSVLIIRLLYRTFLTNAPLKDLREIEDEAEAEEEEEGIKEASLMLGKSDLVKENKEIIEDVVSKLHVE